MRETSRSKDKKTPGDQYECSYSTLLLFKLRKYFKASFIKTKQVESAHGGITAKSFQLSSSSRDVNYIYYFTHMQRA